jgi:hypothetical protein
MNADGEKFYGHRFSEKVDGFDKDKKMIEPKAPLYLVESNGVTINAFDTREALAEWVIGTKNNPSDYEYITLGPPPADRTFSGIHRTRIPCYGMLKQIENY